mgnify:CR=1 FL=1
MKKYKVSLALKVPANFECVVQARSEKHARQFALQKYENAEYDSRNFTEPDWLYQSLELEADRWIYIEVIE